MTARDGPYTTKDRAQLRKLAQDRVLYQEKCLSIRAEDGRVLPFLHNPAQKMVTSVRRRLQSEGRQVRLIILKARRHGITTQQQADSFHMIATQPFRRAVTLAHTDLATEEIFSISDFFHESLHEGFRPHRLTQRNKRNLNYPKMRSMFYIGTAGGRGFGRSDTFHRVHWSEVAWSAGNSTTQKNLLVGLTEAGRAGEIVLESTPNGSGGLFHEIWKRAKQGRGSWTPIFLPWWYDPRNWVVLEEEEAHELVRSYTDEEKNLIERVSNDGTPLQPEQMAWRRAKRAEPEYEGDLFFQEYAEDDVTCFLISGTTWFDMSIIRKLLDRVPPPESVRRGGEIEIYENVKPGYAYTIGCDVGEGLPNSHFSVAMILERESMKQVARLRCRMDPTEFGHQVAALGHEYNTALVGIEKNNHGHSVLNTLSNTVHYPNIYRHRDYDVTAGTTMKLGYETTKKTKPILIQDLREAIHKGHMEVRSRTLLEECTTYVHLGDAKYGTKNEEDTDDEIMATAIAIQIRKSGQDDLASPLDQDQISEFGTERLYGPTTDDDSRLY